MRKLLNRFFIEGSSGMACGLFVTLVLGTVLQQTAGLLEGQMAALLLHLGQLAVSLTGAGIGIGIATRLGESSLAAICAAIAGTVGAFAEEFASGALFTTEGTLSLSGKAEPLGAFFAAFTAIELVRLIEGKTRADLILAPVSGILGGSLVGIWAGIPITHLLQYLGEAMNWATQQKPLLMGITVSVLMGIFITLPLNSVALAVSLNLTGLAAGAATIGCCCSMVGFAVAGYRENGVGGLCSLGLGTPFLEFHKIMQRPLIWLPTILSSAILGPVGTMAAKMSNTAAGAGAGSMGLLGQISTFQTMTAQEEPAIVMTKIVLLHFVLPGLLSLGIAEGMRKLRLIKDGDMALAL